MVHYLLLKFNPGLFLIKYFRWRFILIRSLNLCCLELKKFKSKRIVFAVIPTPTCW